MSGPGSAPVGRALRARLAAEGMEAAPWSNGPGDRYGAHRHAYDKVIVVVNGSIAFGLPELGGTIDLHAGDRLQLPAATRHDAVAGPSGVTCLEVHLPAGSLPGLPVRHAAGTW